MKVTEQIDAADPAGAVTAEAGDEAKPAKAARARAAKLAVVESPADEAAGATDVATEADATGADTAAEVGAAEGGAATAKATELAGKGHPGAYARLVEPK